MKEEKITIEEWLDDYSNVELENRLMASYDAMLVERENAKELLNNLNQGIYAIDPHYLQAIKECQSTIDNSYYFHKWINRDDANYADYMNAVVSDYADYIGRPLNQEELQYIEEDEDTFDGYLQRVIDAKTQNYVPVIH